jgi:hypothetical protein
MYYSSPCEIMRLEACSSKQNCGKIDFCRFQCDKVAESPDVTDVTFFFFLQSPGIFDPSRLQRLSHGLYFTYKYKKNTVT